MGISVLIKGLNKNLKFPDGTPTDDIEGLIKEKWGVIEQAVGLPMDAASVELRAKELGFYPNTLYHGTSTSKSKGDLFDEFQLFEGQDMSRSVSRSEVGKLGVSIAEQPGVAGDFARQASPESGAGSAILPVRFRSDQMASINLVGDETNSEIFGAVVDTWNKGFDSIRFTNYTTPAGTKGSFFLLKNPNQIRSKFAKFDTSKKESSNLLASLAGLGSLAGGTLFSDDSFASEGERIKHLLVGGGNGEDRSYEFSGVIGSGAPRKAQLQALIMRGLATADEINEQLSDTAADFVFEKTGKILPKEAAAAAAAATKAITSVFSPI